MQFSNVIEYNPVHFASHSPGLFCNKAPLPVILRGQFKYTSINLEEGNSGTVQRLARAIGACYEKICKESLEKSLPQEVNNFMIYEIVFIPQKDAVSSSTDLPYPEASFKIISNIAVNAFIAQRGLPLIDADIEKIILTKMVDLKFNESSCRIELVLNDAAEQRLGVSNLSFFHPREGLSKVKKTDEQVIPSRRESSSVLNLSEMAQPSSNRFNDPDMIMQDVMYNDWV